MPPASIAVACDSTDPERCARADALSESLSLPVVSPADRGHEVLLVVTDARLELRLTVGTFGPVWCEFVEGAMGFRRRVGAEHAGLLARAVGTKRQGPGGLRVIDATAGLGRDAFMLAMVGCNVMAIERSPIMRELLLDGLRRAGEEPELCDAVKRTEVRQGDATSMLAEAAGAFKPDVIYLDPMFPERRKSAAVKKEMIACRLVAGEDEDAPNLLAAALKTGVHRVTVKRPLHAPSIAGPQPTLVMKGKAVRYDVYVQTAG